MGTPNVGKVYLYSAFGFLNMETSGPEPEHGANSTVLLGSAQVFLYTPLSR